MFLSLSTSLVVVLLLFSLPRVFSLPFLLSLLLSLLDELLENSLEEMLISSLLVLVTIFLAPYFLAYLSFYSLRPFFFRVATLYLRSLFYKVSRIC